MDSEEEIKEMVKEDFKSRSVSLSNIEIKVEKNENVYELPNLVMTDGRIQTFHRWNITLNKKT